MKITRILLSSMVLLLVGTIIGLLYLNKTVTIQVNDESHTAKVWAWQVGQVLTAAGVEVRAGDIVTPSPGDWLQEGTLISIQRAVQVQVYADDQITHLLTTAETPAEIFTEAEINFGAQDRLLVNGEASDPYQVLSGRPTHSLQIQRPASVELMAGGSKQSFQTFASSLGGALSDQNIYLQAGDQLLPEADTALVVSANETYPVSLQSARPITIESANGTITSLVQAANTGEALAQAGMALQGLDYSLPAAGEPLPANGHIRIVRVHTEVILETEALPFGVEYIPLPEVELDTQQVVQTGAYGIQARRVQVRYEDGVEVAREISDEWVAQAPQPRIVGYGTKIVIRTEVAADGSTIEYWRKVDVFATRYSPCNLGIPNYCNSTTASGKTLEKGMIAVIRPWYNSMRGSGVYVPFYGYATIEDIGAGFSDRHWIDLAYSDEEWTNTSGWTTVYFLTPVPANVMWILE